MRIHSTIWTLLLIVASLSVSCAPLKDVEPGKIIATGSVKIPEEALPSPPPSVTSPEKIDTKWARHALESVGMGERTSGVSTGQSFLIAKQTAFENALRNLAEQIKDVRLSSNLTLGDLLAQDESLRIKVTNAMRQAKVIKKEKTDDAGYAVTLKFNLSLIEEYIELPSSREGTSSLPSETEEEKSTREKEVKRATGQKAVAEARKNLLNRVKKMIINSGVTVEEYMRASEIVRIRIEHLVEQSRVVRTIYNTNGTIEAHVEISPAEVRKCLE